MKSGDFREDGARRLTPEETEDAERFIAQLKRIPDSEYEAGRLMAMAFMSGIEEAAGESSEPQKKKRV